MALTLPNKKIFSEALVINKLPEVMGKDAADIEGKTYYRKPVHILKPKNLESMTIFLEHSTAQKEYFRLGQKEAEEFFAGLQHVPPA